MEYSKKIKTFNDLETWQQGHQLNILAYRYTEKFPLTEKYGLVGQIRRGVVSVTSNTAEGFGRYGPADKNRFYNITRAAILELQSQFIISLELNFLSKSQFDELMDLSITVHKPLNGLIRSTNKRY